MGIVVQPNVETGAVESKSEALFLELSLSVEYIQTAILVKRQVIVSCSAKFDARFMQRGASR
jgi:hypothetical protein